MKNLETIDGQSVSRLESFGTDLAEAYKVAFAGSPWFEVSRCCEETCDIEYQELAVDTSCPDCSSTLVEAYNAEELVRAWRAIIEDENAMMEVALQDGVPVRATIARPTNPAELFERKYAQIAEMEQWRADNLPSEFVWIEDTFANRNITPSGNLATRGRTLGRIAAAYSGLQIVTRTLAPAVVRATVRDVGANTDIYLGLDAAGVLEADGARSIGEAPDRRTLLRVEGSGLAV